MRALAEVLEAVVLVGREAGGFGYALAVLIDAAGEDAVDQLQLVGLVLEKVAGFGLVQLATLEADVGAHDLAHAVLDGRQVVGR